MGHYTENWALAQDFVESWTDSADDYAATLEECGCDEFPARHPAMPVEEQSRG